MDLRRSQMKFNYLKHTLIHSHTTIYILWMLLLSYPQIIDSSWAFSSHIPYVTVIRLLWASQISGFTITLQCLCECFDWWSTAVSRHRVCSSTLDTVWRIWHPWSEDFMICSSARRTVNSPSSGASMHTSKSSMQVKLCIVIRFFVSTFTPSSYLRIIRYLG